jgi:hypothetical protein
MTRRDRGYVLRIAKGEQFGDDDEFVPVCTFTIEQYQCGLRAGEQLRLRQDFPIRNAEGAVISVVPAGSIWTVLTGATEDPDTVWLEEPDGELHSWDDDATIYETFEKHFT